MLLPHTQMQHLGSKFYSTMLLHIQYAIVRLAASMQKLQKQTRGSLTTTQLVRMIAVTFRSPGPHKQALLTQVTTLDSSVKHWLLGKPICVYCSRVHGLVAHFCTSSAVRKRHASAGSTPGKISSKCL